MTYRYCAALMGDAHTVRVAKEGGNYKITVNDQSRLITVAKTGEATLLITIEGKQYRAAVARAGDDIYVALNGQSYHLQRDDERKSRRGQGEDVAASVIEASMTGTVMQVNASVGKQVRKGQTLIILEAMKMELRLKAPCDGIVAALQCQPGDLVDQGQVLLALNDER